MNKITWTAVAGDVRRRDGSHYVWSFIILEFCLTQIIPLPYLVFLVHINMTNISKQRILYLCMRNKPGDTMIRKGRITLLQSNMA